MATATKVEVEKLLELDNKTLWKQLRIDLTDTWIAFKRTCRILSILKERYLADKKIGKTIRERTKAFHEAARDEVGYSTSYISGLIRVANSKALMYMENTVGAKIGTSTAMLLAQKRVMALPNYSSVLKRVKTRAITNGNVVTYAAVRSMLYPAENYRVKAIAYSELGTLTYTPKVAGTSLKEIREDIRTMLDAGAMYLDRSKRRKRSRVRKPE